MAVCAREQGGKARRLPSRAVRESKMAEMRSAYTVDLDRNAANYVPLSPLGFIARSAQVFPDRLAAVHGARRYSWAESYRRCRRLASALGRAGVAKNDTAALIATNTPEAFAAHFRS